MNIQNAAQYIHRGQEVEALNHAEQWELATSESLVAMLAMGATEFRLKAKPPTKLKTRVYAYKNLANTGMRAGMWSSTDGCDQAYCEEYYTGREFQWLGDEIEHDVATD